MRATGVVIALMVVLVVAPLARARDELPAQVSWSATATDGTTLVVPNDRPTVLAFVRAEQKQSQEMLERLKAVVGEGAAVQVAQVVSGQSAGQRATDLANGDTNWPVCADEQYVASGLMNVHVWPTVVVIAPDGTVVGRLPGLTASFATDAQAYIALASGQIDGAELEQRLATRQTVTSTPAQAATRHVEVAQRLLDHGKLEQAQAELDQALKLDPSSARTRLLQAKVLVEANKPADALAQVEQIPPGTVPPSQVAQVRAAAYVAQEEWDDARAACAEALKLNPNPAEAHYLSGLVAQHDGDASKAAEHFRRAYETSRKGSTLGQD